MKLISKFGIGDLVQRKYETENRDYFVVHEIMNVITDTCHVGTQVFYLCKALILKKLFEKEYSKTGDFTWAIHPHIGNDDNSTGMKKYREDELIHINKKYRDIIK